MPLHEAAATALLAHCSHCSLALNQRYISIHCVCSVWAIYIYISYIFPGRQPCQCQNGGVCRDPNFPTQCDCPAGYYGTLCETRRGGFPYISILLCFRYWNITYEDEKQNFYKFGIRSCWCRNICLYTCGLFKWCSSFRYEFCPSCANTNSYQYKRIELIAKTHDPNCVQWNCTGILWYLLFSML